MSTFRFIAFFLKKYQILFNHIKNGHNKIDLNGYPVDLAKCEILINLHHIFYYLLT